MNRESSLAILNNLLLRNEKAGDRYDEAAGETEDASLSEWLHSLAHHRRKLAAAVRQLIEDMPPTPLPANTNSRPWLEDHQDELYDALRAQKRQRVAEICRQSEEALSDYYKTSLKQENLVAAIYDQLTAQHQEVLAVIRKAERLATAPQLKNNGF